jgi:hypothetical protein
MTPGPDSPSQKRPSWVTAVTFSPDGKTLATDTVVCGRRSSLTVWPQDMADGLM